MANGVMSPMSDMAMLRDHDISVLAPGPEVFSCGLNPDVAAGGHSVANASNRFWKTRHLAGFTNAGLRPEDQHRLLDCRCRITAIVDRPAQCAPQNPLAEFNAARAAFGDRRHTLDGLDGLACACADLLRRAVQPISADGSVVER